MAGCDYYNCDLCGQGKVFYDANVDWEDFANRIGNVICICKSCSLLNEIIVVSKTSGIKSKILEDHNPGLRWILNPLKESK